MQKNCVLLAFSLKLSRHHPHRIKSLVIIRVPSFVLNILHLVAHVILMQHEGLMDQTLLPPTLLIAPSLVPRLFLVRGKRKWAWGRSYIAPLNFKGIEDQIGCIHITIMLASTLLVPHCWSCNTKAICHTPWWESGNTTGTTYEYHQKVDSKCLYVTVFILKQWSQPGLHK